MIASKTRKLMLTAALGSPLLLAGCGGWPLNQQAAKETAQRAAQATQEKQLEQRAAAQALSTIKKEARSAGLQAGHRATVNCLRSERAQTDGSELRCEDWSYVQQNFASN